MLTKPYLVLVARLPVPLLAALLCIAPLSFAQLANHEDDALMNEILVTATKRVASIQDIPISVTAFGAEILTSRGAEDIRAITNLSPSVNFVTSQSTANTTSVRIRGVGTTGNNAGFESSVGIFIDGVYQPRPGMALGEFVDVKQVEILRGPQGTLFGRNTSVGAISIKSKRPNIYDNEGFTNFSVGNFSMLNIQAGYNQPVGDSLAFRITGSYRKRDGSMNNSDSTLPDSNDRDRYLLRAQGLWEPLEEFSIRLIADVSKSDELCCDPVLVTLNADGSQPAGTTVANPDKAVEDRITDSTGRREQSDQAGISAELVWAINEAVELTYIPAYRELEAKNSGDDDFTRSDVIGSQASNPNLADVDSQTHELRLQGKLIDDRLDWLFGMYYAKEDVSELSIRTAGADLLFLPAFPNASQDGSNAANLFEQSAEAYSIFTHNVFQLTDALSFTLGLRYVDEAKKGGLISSKGQAVLCPGPGSPATDSFYCNPLWTPADQSNGFYATYPNEKFEDDALTYTGNVSYVLSADAMAYVSLSEGFKSGGLNLDITGTGAAEPTFRSEGVRSYEAGIKSKIFDGFVTANLAVFHMDIEDFQILDLQGLSFNVFNVDKAKSSGIELDVNAQIAPNLLLSSSMVYTDARFPSDCSTTSVAIKQCGHDLPNAPEFVAVLGADWEIGLRNKMQLTLAPNVRYESSSQPATNNPDFKQGSSTIVDFRASLADASKSNAVEFWVKNLTDEHTLTRAFDTLSELGNQATSGSISSWVIDPRSYGITVRTKF